MKFTTFSFLFFVIFSGSINAQETTESIKFIKFEEVELAPRFEGCNQESGTDCTKTKLLNFINDSFENSEISDSIPEEEKIALIKFYIDIDGKVIRPYVISKSQEFKKALILILTSLPNFTPGLQENEPAIIIVDLPINLSSQATSTLYSYDDEALSSVAIFKKCRNKNDSKSCTVGIIQSMLMDNPKNTKIKLPKNKLISAIIKFVINENGIVSQITVEGSYKIFNNEIRKIIEVLPKFDPAKIDGKPVPVLFQIPVAFKKF